MLRDAPPRAPSLRARKIFSPSQGRLLQNAPVASLQKKKIPFPRKYAREEFHRKAVMPGGNGRVRGEDTLVPDFINVLATNGVASGSLRFFAKQFKSQQRRVPFIHVVARQVVVAESAQHAHAADAE